ncbi:dihydroorotate dehydrogenase electron transfer subunit [Burkholderia ubonensis]|uniref:dihydroorotate dehydrogenase electron transfer subunit n=1 Tax=Burkholderia ubonensis TaxID=101571 RepID=UPI00075C28B2|nr:dihydroorotate dehydrogenase electron transfer subunit [Burkholderia ubonensis]KVX89055.1 oxidoreductase [Burkholderia ubonensis]
MDVIDAARACAQPWAASVATHACDVVAHHAVNRRYRYLRVRANAPLASVTQAGQFYQLVCPVTDQHRPFLPRPMSVYGVGPGAGEIEFLYNVTGEGTRALARLGVGERLPIVGPLGRPFTLDPGARRLLLVARGVGLATMAPLVQRAARSGIALTAVMSARTPDDLMTAEFLRGAPADVHAVFDSDGTSAVANVGALLRDAIARDRPDAVYTCGSQRLLALLQRVLADHPSMRGEVALEQRMACGMGVCLSCVRMFDDGETRAFRRVCREGPVFAIRDVVAEVEFG